VATSGDSLPPESQNRPEPGSTRRGRWGIVALVVLLFGASVYGLVASETERARTEELAAQNQALNRSLAQVQRDLQSVSAQLAALTRQQQEQKRPEQRKLEPPRKAAAGTVRRSALRPSVEPNNDSRYRQIQDKIADQQRQLVTTRRDLDSTREELGKTRQDLSGRLDTTRDVLSGSIARNHDELVALQKRGERNYFEFELDKSKQFQKIGPMSVSLRKVNFKHKYYDLAMIVDDQTLEKKHINLYEPVVIKLSGESQPVELVVNQIHKDDVRGYVSQPKYKLTELPPSAGSSSASLSSAQASSSQP
jgi:hypothetical protein